MNKRSSVDWIVLYAEAMILVVCVFLAFSASSTGIRLLFLLPIPLFIMAIVHIWKTP